MPTGAFDPVPQTEDKDGLPNLGHADFIHKTSVGAPSFTYGKREMFQKGNVVHSNFYAPNDFLSPVLSMIFQTQGKRVDAKVEVHGKLRHRCH